MDEVQRLSMHELTDRFGIEVAVGATHIWFQAKVLYDVVYRMSGDHDAAVAAVHDGFVFSSDAMHREWPEASAIDVETVETIVSLVLKDITRRSEVTA